jgi:hypothetical protein
MAYFFVILVFGFHLAGECKEFGKLDCLENNVVFLGCLTTFCQENSHVEKVGIMADDAADQLLIFVLSL